MKTGVELLQEDLNKHRLFTFSRLLDSLFGGGLPCGKLCELSGMPGTGKTQLAMQLAVNVTIPSSGVNGLNGRCVFFDTEETVVPSRMADMAHALVSHIHNSVRLQLPTPFTAESVLQSVTLVRTQSIAEVLAWVRILQQQHQDQQNGAPALLPVKLIVIDSISSLLRSGCGQDGEVDTDPVPRLRQLSRVGARLADCARALDCVVLVTNHTVTKIRETGAVSFTPALHDVFGAFCSVRLELMHPTGASHRLYDSYDCDDDESGNSRVTRFARAVKGADPGKLVSFCITSNGIRDAENYKKNK